MRYYIYAYNYTDGTYITSVNGMNFMSFGIYITPDNLLVAGGALSTSPPTPVVTIINPGLTSTNMSFKDLTSFGAIVT